MCVSACVCVSVCVCVCVCVCMSLVVVHIHSCAICKDFSAYFFGLKIVNACLLLL